MTPQTVQNVDKNTLTVDAIMAYIAEYYPLLEVDKHYHKTDAQSIVEHQEDSPIIFLFFYNYGIDSLAIPSLMQEERLTDKFREYKAGTMWDRKDNLFKELLPCHMDRIIGEICTEFPYDPHTQNLPKLHGEIIIPDFRYIFASLSYPLRKLMVETTREGMTEYNRLYEAYSVEVETLMIYARDERCLRATMSLNPSRYKDTGEFYFQVDYLIDGKRKLAYNGAIIVSRDGSVSRHH